MNNKRSFFLLTLLIISAIAHAQIVVRKEPRHKNVLENKYLRLLDVHIAPGDTSLFHIHSTPSVFLILTNTTVGAQILGQDWTKSQEVAGDSWYNSFLNDALIHRVANCDTVPYHVTDIEILGGYSNSRKFKPLKFDILFENDRVLAYSVSNSSLNQKVISKRGPLIAQLVEGVQVVLHDARTKETRTLSKGGYLYIKPKSSFYLTTVGDEKINLVLVEIK